MQGALVRSGSHSRVDLRLADVHKRFGDVTALTGVQLHMRGGEIHALLGENGAGKTTLMNVVCGLVRPDRGSIQVDGRAVELRSPRDARRLGIGMVHQHFTVVDRLTTTENLALSLVGDQWRWSPGRVAERALDLAKAVGLDIGDPDAIAGSLAVGTRQRIEILKALAGDTRVLILDEPTAVLTPQEVEQLFTVLRRLRDEGRLVVFITHKLREARAVADRISVLRRGAVIGTGTPADLSDAEIAVWMVGSAVTAARRAAGKLEGESLRLEGLQLGSVASPAGEVNLVLRAGEIFGIAGVDGNGQTELFELLAGLRAPARGSIFVNGRRLDVFSPASALAAGIGVIPPDRGQEGLVGAMTVAENLLLCRTLLDRFSRRGLLAAAEVDAFARAQAERYRIRGPALAARAANLSGGNQQRVIIARALAATPEVLIAVNPTRGLDIAASKAVHEALNAFVGEGKSVLLISTDLDEILEMSDRVGVLYRHRLSAPLTPPYSADRIGLLMAGGKDAGCA